MQPIMEGNTIPDWFLKLNQNQRIELKGMMTGIGGVSWEQLTAIGFSYREKIELLHMKISQYFKV